MKALIVIDIPEDHLVVTLNDLYERLNGYKCDLKPMPEKKEDGYPNDDYTIGKADGWNACLDEILGETE